MTSYDLTTRRVFDHRGQYREEPADWRDCSDADNLAITRSRKSVYGFELGMVSRMSIHLLMVSASNILITWLNLVTSSVIRPATNCVSITRNHAAGLAAQNAIFWTVTAAFWTEVILFSAVSVCSKLLFRVRCPFDFWGVLVFVCEFLESVVKSSNNINDSWSNIPTTKTFWKNWFREAIYNYTFSVQSNLIPMMTDD